MFSRFKIRAISALAFAVIMIGGILWSYHSYLILFFLLLNLLLNEYFNIIKKTRKPNRISKYYKPLAFITGSLAFIFSALHLNGAIPFHMMVVPMSLLLLFFVLELYSNSEKPLENIGYNLTGLIWIAVPIVLSQFLILREFDGYNSWLLLSVIVLVWINDVSAYLIGSRIGRTPLFKRISPGKTWEGSLAGLTACVGVSAAFYSIYDGMDMFEHLTLSNWLSIGVIVYVFGSLGDLVESMMKRSLDLKDTGSIMPGHGGFLDRFDALLFTIPFVVLYLMMFVN